MKIVADENIPLVEEFFGGFGEIVRRPGREMTQQDLLDADVLLVRSVTPVNEALLKGTSVRFVGTCTIGVDHLDRDYFEQNGIGWSSAPGCNATSVVEYVYAALAHLDVAWLQQRVGIIGCGNVGGRLHKRLRAQGVECRCYDPFLSVEDNEDLTTLEAVLECDVVCMHTPLTHDGPHSSFHLLGTAELAQLKPGAVLLNAGRGPVIDNTALLAHLESGADLRVVLDVWEPEPAISTALLDKVALGSPHIAGYSYDGKMQGTFMIYQALCKHLGVTPERDLKTLRPQVEDPERTFPAGDFWSGLKTLIPQVYAIAEDDRRLRELADQHRNDSTETEFARGFDQLRKNYPKRREFDNYRLTREKPREGQSEGEQRLAEADNKKLQALGFRF